MQKNKYKWSSGLIIFLLTGIIYVFIEVVYTAVSGEALHKYKIVSGSLMGFSSIYMFFVGGFMGFILGKLNELRLVKDNLIIFFQAVIGGVIITLTELISGLILNVWLEFNIWDYTRYPFNFMGQICLSRSLGWFFISPLAFWFDDFVKAELYQIGKPYSLWSVYLRLIQFK